MITELQPYPEYKVSKLPWLGKIPAHWDEQRAKYFFREVDHSSQTGEEELLSVSHITGVTPRSQKNVTMFKAESYVGSKLCQAGDLVINTMWAWMAALGVARQTGIVSPSYGVYRTTNPDAFIPDFVDHLLRTKPYASEYLCRSTGIRLSRLRLYPERFLTIPIVSPPVDEQRKMVAFLHAMNQKIRQFTRIKRRLIELLNEQKQAIIDRAITRGLNPGVRLKPSGIDWLGDLPEHWEMRRLKYVVQNVNEQTASLRDGEIYVALESVQSWTGRISLPDGEVSFDSQVKRFKANDILFGKLRPYLAKVTRPQQPGVCVGEFLVLRPSDTSVLPSYLEQKLRSKQIIDLVNSSTFGAKMPRADWTFIGNVQIAYSPNHNEQSGILDRIAAETATLTSAIDRAQREITLIQEYRTRLIADVVTGQVDLRCLGPETVGADAGEPVSWDEEELTESQNTEDHEAVEEVVYAD